MIGAISAGNTVLLKASELSPNASALLAKTIPSYLDNKAIKVIEGGPDVATILLQHQWDKIFFTGITLFTPQHSIISFVRIPTTIKWTGLISLYIN